MDSRVIQSYAKRGHLSMTVWARYKRRTSSCPAQYALLSHLSLMVTYYTSTENN